MSFFVKHTNMIKISVDTYAENSINTIAVPKEDSKAVLWIKMDDMQDKLSVKNIFEMTKEAIKGIYETKRLTNKQIKK